MKNLIFGLIMIIGISCNKSADPQPLKYISLVGSWKMVTNDGVDLTFDIVSDTTKSGFSISNPIVTYDGVSSTDSGHNNTPSISLSGNIYDFNLATGFVSPTSTTWNATYLNQLTVNTSKTVITGTSGYVSLAGYGSSIKPPYILNFSNPIILNRVK